MRVLIVDDSADARLLLRLRLDLCDGIDVIGEAEDGLEGVGAIDLLRPDVVIMDFHMPVMDGLEATRRAKELAPGTEIVTFTSAPPSHIDEQMLAAGASRCFSKDDLEELLAYLGC